MKLICYLCNGYPSLDESEKIAQSYIDAGCDVIEIDVPSHDPYLESDLIAGRMKDALEKCDDDDRYLAQIERVVHKHPNTEFIFLLYENTVLRIGVEKTIEFCKKNNLMDMIYVGMNSPETKQQLIDAGIKVSCYVQYQLLEEEIEAAKASNGFVYMQAKPLQNNIRAGYETLKDCISYLRECGIDRPIYCGVGVHSEEDVAMVKEAGADGAFIGSSILKIQDNPDALTATIQSYKKACQD